MGDSFTATSPLPAIQGGSNKIATTSITDGIIAAMSGRDFGDYNEHRPRTDRFICKITGNETGGGKYTCIVYTCKTGLNDPTASVSSTDIEGEAIFNTAVYVNLQETSTHDLTHADNTTQKYFVGHFNGYTSESPQRAVFIGNALWTTACP